MTIASADLLPITDSLGIMYNDLLALAATTPGAEIATGADNNATRVLALTDIDVVKDLATGFAALVTAADAPNAKVSDLFGTALQAIQKHTSNLNTYLTTNTVKVTSSFAALWRAQFGVTNLAPANVFKDAAVIARTVTITGAATDTEAAGTNLDPTLVAPAQYEVEVTTNIGSSVTVTLTMIKADNTTETKTVAFTSDTAGTKIDIGTGSNVYIGCAGSSHASGGVSGVFKIQNKVARVAAI